MRISDWSSDVCSSDLVYNGIAIEVLQHRREERQRGQGDRTFQKHEEHACDDIAVAKEFALEQRPFGRCEMNHGDPESGNRNAAFNHDFPALEPVFVLAAVEHQLKGRNAQRYHAEAETVEAPLRARPGWQKQPENGQGQRADWDIDVKTPAPAVVLDRKSTRLKSSH